MFLKWNFHFCVCWWQFHKDVTICCHLLPPTPWSTTTCLLLALSWRHLEWCSHNYKKWSEVNVTQSCLTLCDRIDYRVHGILQARILEWVAFPFSRGSSQPRDWTQVSHTAGGFFSSWATREAQEYWRRVAHPFSSRYSRLTIMEDADNYLVMHGLYSEPY